MAQVLNKFSFRKILLNLLLLILANIAIASKHENFEFMDQMIIFKKNTKLGKCSEEIVYPELLSKDYQHLADKMNKEINNFVRNFRFCNSKAKNYQYKTNYKIIQASDDVMSIKWTTENNGKLLHIDAINFTVENGEAVLVESAIKPLAKDFMIQMIRLSKGILTKNADYNQFLQKIADRSIQYYMEKNKWYLLFNYPIDSGKHPFYLKKIPKASLKQGS